MDKHTAQNANAKPALMRYREVAAYLGCSYDSVKTMAENGKLTRVSFGNSGRSRYITRASVEKFLRGE